MRLHLNLGVHHSLIFVHPSLEDKAVVDRKIFTEDELINLSKKTLFLLCVKHIL